MRIVKPDAQIIYRENTTPYQFIEKIGRTCYKSTDKITDGSAVKFVAGLKNSKHYAMIEHYWVHIVVDAVPEDVKLGLEALAENFFDRHGGYQDFTKFVQITHFNNLYISAPLRVFIEFDELCEHTKNRGVSYSRNPVHDIMGAVAFKFPELIDPHKWSTNSIASVVDDEELFCDSMALDMCLFSKETLVKEQMKHRTHTIKFVCDRGVSHEFVRHRVASFAQESTRYCNYTKDKFGSEITVIEPFFFVDGYLDKEHWSARYGAWVSACESAEESYNALIKDGATPQEARAVLPNSLKTELIITANEEEWQHIIDLRYTGVTGAPHPQMKEAMGIIVNELVYASKGRLHI